MRNFLSRRSTLKFLSALGAVGAGTVSQAKESLPQKSHLVTNGYSTADLELDTPAKRNRAIAKVIGSIGDDEVHSFMRFHIYGFAGKNAVPFFSMNNYIIQYWSPTEKEDEFQVKHYEVGYFTQFDTDQPITHWKNPFTDETVELHQFILGPVFRRYTPDGVISLGVAPKPLRVNVIGDRVFVPAQSLETFPNMFPPSEWPELSTDDQVYWDSMFTYSAALKDVIDPSVTTAKAEIHMQNLTSWQPFLHLGRVPGRSMARAFGTNITGFEDLTPDVRHGFETHTPEIFDTKNWTQTRFDNIDYYQKMMKEKGK